MLPKSLAKLGAAAAAVTQLPADFPPPVLGSAPTGAADEFEDPEEFKLSEYDDEEDEFDEDDLPFDGVAPPVTLEAPFSASNDDAVALAPSISRDLHALLTQLRSLSTRLATLESIVETPGSGWKWYAPFARAQAPPPRREQERIAGSDVMTGIGSGISLSKILTMGSLSAAAAAVGVAAVAAWGRHRR